jgi:hypothetical protein
MIISYYPGAGGNRYLQFLRNKEFNLRGIAYDGIFPEATLDDRYLLTTQNKDKKYVLTHCVNYDRINQVLGSGNITFIKSDYKKSLRRAWALNESHKTNLTPLDSIWAFICWHNDYYLKYPFSTDNAVVVDIDTDNTAFTSVIQNELLQYQNKLFDFCWDVYNNNGPTAPIIDLYNEIYEK